MNYSYDIRPRPNLDGGGWNLHLFENGKAAGLVDFAATENENSQLDAAKIAYLRAEAEAKLWVKGRKVYSKRRLRLAVHPVPAFLLGLLVVLCLFNVLKQVL
jgi:hypothetical protein